MNAVLSWQSNGLPLAEHRNIDIERNFSQARSQKFAMGRAVLGSRRRQLGVWGETLNHRNLEVCTGVWGLSPQRSKIVYFFWQKLLNFRPLLRKIIIKISAIRRSPQPLKAIGGLNAKLLAAGGTGIWGQSPQRSKILYFLAKITNFKAYFDKK